MDVMQVGQSFQHSVHSIGLPDGRFVVGATDGGGPRVAIGNSDELLVDEFTFDPGFRGGVRVALFRDVVYVGAGNGGAPALKKYDFNTGQLLSCEFDGDKNSRTGWNGTIQLPPSQQTLVPHPTAPGDPQWIERQLRNLPERFQTWGRDHFVLTIHNAESIVSLREFGRLNPNSRTPNHGDGLRTWGQVTSAHLPGVGTFIQELDTEIALHEWFHALEESLDEGTQTEWEGVHQQLNLTGYLASEKEAFAVYGQNYSLDLFVPPSVFSFFDGLLRGG